LLDNYSDQLPPPQTKTFVERRTLKLTIEKVCETIILFLSI